MEEKEVKIIIKGDKESVEKVKKDLDNNKNVKVKVEDTDEQISEEVNLDE